MVRHIICVDQRDEAVFPTRGVRLQISNELAGLGGSVASLKAELHLQLNHTLSDTLGVVVQATCAMGLLQDVYGTELADHFFLGGPSSLRGFQHRGVGPHCDGQALGGRVSHSTSSFLLLRLHNERGFCHICLGHCVGGLISLVYVTLANDQTHHQTVSKNGLDGLQD
ncbi:hypothetical protein HF086_015186 [Spodoptera exigua]|uniref:Bacterial surface antigen (D15) domain-containing protein n=1 Tax=Spodoptera exigua TaxID=7107 RepID=A0A922SS38_SPOEX|nr:hypothetical protein HF086_015186 [Spodoptera exigua]